MKREIAHIALVVRDYDEAIEFFTGKLDFELVQDTALPDENKRWVVVNPKNSRGTRILLAKASTAEQLKSVGAQSGGRVFLFLSTDNFWRDYEIFKESGVGFVRGPNEYDYGTVAVFEDLYGNLWDLIQYSSQESDGANDT